MESEKSQDEINIAEWDNAENWSSLYFSKKDSRTFVPKRNPRKGWTINFGNASGSRWVYYFFGIFFLIGCTLGAIIATLLLLWIGVCD